MKIGILGGSGPLGRKLAEGWQRGGHDVVIGSRRPQAKPADLSLPFQTHAQAAASRDVVVLAVPAAAAGPVAEEIAPHLSDGTVVLSVMVPLNPDDPLSLSPPPEGSIAEHVASRLPDGTPVVSGFHTLSAHASDDEATDILLCGRGRNARSLIAQLVSTLGYRPVDCGALRMSRILEQLTPLMIAINKRYHVGAAGVHITGLDAR